MVYLILLNFAAFLPCTSSITAAVLPGESGAVQLLRVVLAALRSLLSSDSATAIKKVREDALIVTNNAEQCLCNVLEVM